MLTFLEVNGYEVETMDPELADWIIGLSAGTTPEDLAGPGRPQRRAPSFGAWPSEPVSVIASRRISCVTPMSLK